MACQACHGAIAEAERSPDTQSEPVRRCPTCGELAARLVTVSSHTRAVSLALVPVGEVGQGASFDYACDQCGHGFTLLSKIRRRWVIYGVVVGVLMGGFAFADTTVFIAALGGAVALSMGAWLAWDSHTRRKSEP